MILNLITRGKLSLILSDYYYYLFRSEASEDDIQSTKELQNTESLGTKVVDILTKTLYRKETASLLFIENSI